MLGVGCRVFFSDVRKVLSVRVILGFIVGFTGLGVRLVADEGCD
jgi:hypothetical protein